MMCNHAAPRDALAKFESVLMHVFFAAQYPKSAAPWKHRSRLPLVSTLTGSGSVSMLIHFPANGCQSFLGGG